MLTHVIQANMTLNSNNETGLWGLCAGVDQLPLFPFFILGTNSSTQFRRVYVPNVRISLLKTKRPKKFPTFDQNFDLRISFNAGISACVKVQEWNQAGNRISSCQSQDDF